MELVFKGMTILASLLTIIRHTAWLCKALGSGLPPDDSD